MGEIAAKLTFTMRLLPCYSEALNYFLTVPYRKLTTKEDCFLKRDLLPP